MKGAAPPADARLEARALAVEMDDWLGRLFPITRSITGNGNRDSLRLLQEIVPLTLHEVPSGTAVYDWVVPDEWNIQDAWIAAPDGRRIVDFRRSNLHVVSYSDPVRAKLGWPELEPHLRTHAELPQAIPYRTSYYKRAWGFCVTRAQYEELRDLGGPFDVGIDAAFTSGSMTYGELLVPGRSAQEILLSCYICHPSMANDSLSGVLLTAFLARELLQRNDLHYSYRIAFVPETIGAIAYCATNEVAMKRIDLGLVITTVGGPGPFGYKRTFDASHPLNGLIEEVFHDAGVPFRVYPFDIHGSDERQYSSQAFRINTATICRDRYYEYANYHTSLDDLSFVNGAQILETLGLYRRLVEKLEARRVYRNAYPHCEVMLSKRGLYPTDGGVQCPELGGRSELDLILWLLFLSDGRRAIAEIARGLEVQQDVLTPYVRRLEQEGLLVHV